MKYILNFTGLVLMTFFLLSCARQHHLELVGNYKRGAEFDKSQSVSPYYDDIEIARIPFPEVQELTADASITEQQLQPLLSLSRQYNRQLQFEGQTAKMEKAEDRSIQLHDLTVLNKQEAKRVAKSAAKQAMQSGAVSKVLLIILCFLLPPLAVGLAKGIGWPFWLSLILTLCFWIPGVIYALIVILGD